MAVKRLDGLRALMVKRREEQQRRKCRTCRHPEVCRATNEALADMAKRPAEYRGVSTIVLWEWSGAKAAGIGACAYRNHLLAHCAEAWRRVQDGQR